MHGSRSRWYLIDDDDDDNNNYDDDDNDVNDDDDDYSCNSVNFQAGPPDFAWK